MNYFAIFFAKQFNLDFCPRQAGVLHVWACAGGHFSHIVCAWFVHAALPVSLCACASLVKGDLRDPSCYVSMAIIMAI